MLKKIALLLLLIVPMSVFAQKFEHLKSADVLTVMPEFTKAQTDIQAMQKQYEDEMKRATDELTKKYTEYQQEQANLPKNIQERRQKELQELQEKGMQFQQDAQQQLPSDPRSRRGHRRGQHHRSGGQPRPTDGGDAQRGRLYPGRRGAAAGAGGAECELLSHL